MKSKKFLSILIDKRNRKINFLLIVYFSRAFGEIRTVRLPKKMTMGEETHRGFGFVDYYTEADAKVRSIMII